MTTEMKVRKKIIVDLDVVTVALWGKNDPRTPIAKGFIDKVGKKEFMLYTPYFLLELVAQWKHIGLREGIGQFYLKNTDVMLTNDDVDTVFGDAGINDEVLLPRLSELGIKGEDSLLVLIASAIGADSLVTFNRVHLRGNTMKINHFLTENSMKTIEIISPEEVH
jgi:hypothetical protein